VNKNSKARRRTYLTISANHNADANVILVAVNYAGNRGDLVIGCNGLGYG